MRAVRRRLVLTALSLILLWLAGCAAPAQPAGGGAAAPGRAGAATIAETAESVGPSHGSATSPDPDQPWRRWAYAVFGVDAQRVWVAGAGAILSSADGGDTWQVQWRGDGSVHQLHFLDARTGWALTREGVLATTDGETWALISEQALDVVRFLDASTGYGLSRTDGLFRTAGGGRTWLPVPSPEDLRAVCFLDHQTGWATAPRSLYRTGDGGGTWEELGGRPTAQDPNGRTLAGEWVDIACPAADALWARAAFGAGAGTENWGVYRSTDGGRTWTLVAGRARGNFTASKSGPWAVPDRQTVLVAGTGADRLTFEGTFDGGHTWSGALYDEESYTAVPEGSGSAALLWGWPGDLSFSDSLHGWVLNRLPAPGWDLLRTGDGGRTWQPVALPQPREAD